MNIIKRCQNLGPGLLYAAAAIGVSHLVQSTRAGAMFGHQLIWAIILIHFIKYPFFKIGPWYTASTGKNLLHGYKDIGKWALYVIVGLNLATMFIIQAAITLVTSGLIHEIFGVTLDPKILAIFLLFFCSFLLVLGKYKTLDKFVKVIIIILTITTITSVLGAFTAGRKLGIEHTYFSFQDKTHVLFLIALMGWMPAPLDISIWHSIWSEDNNQCSGRKTTLKDSLFDFNVGYIGTAILALCFLGLGALIMYGTGKTFSGNAGSFAAQIIELYTTALGPWAYYLIVLAAFTTMFSTTLTCLDAFARVLKESTLLITESGQQEKPLYNAWVFITVAGTLAILYLFLQNMKALVDFATVLSFVITPVYAILNLMAINNIKENRPTRLFNSYALVSIILLIGFSLYYLSFRF